jgi:hypothetical protein
MTMKQVLRLTASLLVLGIGTGVWAADDKPAAKNAPKDDAKGTLVTTDETTKSAHKWVTIGDVAGVIQKIDKIDKDGTLTLRVHFTTVQPGKVPSYAYRAMGPARTPAQYNQHMQMLQSALSYQMRTTKVKDNVHDFVLRATDDIRVRTMHLPEKTDDKGQTVKYTQEELDKLKGKEVIAGYKAELSDLQVGMIIEVHLVTMKKTADDPDADTNQLYIRKLFIHGSEKVAPAPKK